MTRTEILEEALKIVNGERKDAYGPAEDSFACIAAAWQAYLDSRLKDKPLNGVDVAMMQVILKIIRVNYSPAKPDHFIDIAGYAACAGELATKQ